MRAAAPGGSGGGATASARAGGWEERRLGAHEGAQGARLRPPARREWGRPRARRRRATSDAAIGICAVGRKKIRAKKSAGAARS